MIRVLLFGRLRDVAGWRETVIDPAPKTLSELRLQVTRDNPRLASALAATGVQAAVNRVLVRGDAPLEIDDEVAFMPPMSGG